MYNDTIYTKEFLGLLLANMFYNRATAFGFFTMPVDILSGIIKQK